ncbi:hypothetical protein M422DRAFT_240210 [Sphaerobolus stellatus SS14]|nr:hypothetical protein M422DRAFT_240210 [Sphaerobolus stellatus SS14]
MAPKKRTVDKVPAGTSDVADSDSTSNVIGGNDPTLDPGKDPSQMVSAVSETNTTRPMTWNTRATDQLAHPASKWGMSEDPTQTWSSPDKTPNPHGGNRDPLLPKTYSDYSEPSEQSASANPDPEELALGDQIQEMLDTINEHMDEVKSIYNMSHQVAQLLVKTNESSRRNTWQLPRASRACTLGIPTKDPNNEDVDPHSEQPINWSNNYVDEELTNGQPNIDPELIQSTDGSNNRSDPKQALGNARTELLAKTTVLEWLYADQATADHLNQAATAAQSTCMEYERLLRLSKAGLLNLQDQYQLIHPSENTRETKIQDTPHKSVRYTPFDGIEDNDTDSETTVRNHREGSVPFQQLDDRDILDMSNNESDNALIRMVKYMLDQNIHTTMEKSPLAKAGVKVTPPDKYSGEQSFEALETLSKASFLGMRIEGKALEWFDKMVEPRKYQGTPMNLEQVVTGLYGQYIPSLARHEVSNRFDFIKQGTLSMQEFTTELELYASRMVQ